MKEDVVLDLRGHSHPLAYLLDKGKNPHQDFYSQDYGNLAPNILNPANKRLSEDVNFGRYLHNSVSFDSRQLDQVIKVFSSLLYDHPQGIDS